MPLFIFTFAFMLLLAPACNTTSKTTSDNTATKTEVKIDNNKNTYPVSEYTKAQNLEKYSTAIFAGGCFWCTEAAFERIEGVVDVISGYSGGHVKNPDYYSVGGGSTGHAEAIFIYYDSSIINYDKLLDILFVAHDPTTLNRQGPDAGEEYRSAIFYQSEEEKSIIEKKIESINAGDMYSDKIVTQVAAYDEFWVAEGYHQNYYELNPNHGYVVRISKPKVEKVLKYFPDQIKKKYSK